MVSGLTLEGNSKKHAELKVLSTQEALVPEAPQFDGGRDGGEETTHALVLPGNTASAILQSEEAGNCIINSIYKQ